MKSNKKYLYFLAIAIVIIVWGLDPILMDGFYKMYSPSIFGAISTLASAIVFLPILIRGRSKIDKTFLKITMPIFLMNGLAVAIQRIGLKFTTPSSYTFLEHLCCVSVPLTVFVLTRRPPKKFEILSIITCLAGCVIFLGDGFSGGFNIGDVLCAIAGLLLGVATAATGIYASKIDSGLFMASYMWVAGIVSAISALVLGTVQLNGEPIETPMFNSEPLNIITIVLFGIISMGICWLMRTTAIKHLSAIDVAIVSPLSAVITGVVSVAMGLEKVTFNLVIGGVIILAAAFMSLFDNMVPGKKTKINELETDATHSSCENENVGAQA